VGAVELYPQEVTRALLNLISNGFYAANKRRVEATDDEVFEPVLRAATRNLGKAVEIRIRDNGTGIPRWLGQLLTQRDFGKNSKGLQAASNPSKRA
jgi:signal transduction histidine kinase